MMDASGQTGPFFDQTPEDLQLLAEILGRIEAMLAPPPQGQRWWVELKRLQHLAMGAGPAPTKEERLALYQSLRDAGVLPEEAAFFLIAYTIEWIAEALVQADFERRMAQARDAGTLKEFNERFRADPGLHGRIVAETFRNHGEPAMADLYTRDRPAFERLRQAGRRYFFEE